MLDVSRDSSWFRISLGVEAANLTEFVVRASAEDAAITGLRKYCEDPDTRLGVSPADFMPWGIVVKPLDPIEADYHRALEGVSPDVKLVTDARPLPLPQLTGDSLVNSFESNQDALFLMDRWGRSTGYVDPNPKQ